MNLQPLADKVAVVTGGAGGIRSKNRSKTFARAGARVAIADLDLPAAQAVAAELVTSGTQAFAVSMDVTREQDVERAMRQVLDRFGRIDVLVSNAGIQEL